MRKSIVVVLSATLALGPALTAQAATRQRTEVEKAMGKCAASVIGGALLGAVIGNNTGDGDARRGATIGAVAGVGFCAVLIAMANDRDKRQIAEAQALAAEQGGTQTRQYVGNDGLKRSVSIKAVDFHPTPANVSAGDRAAQPDRLCRRLNTTLEVEGKGTAVVPNEVVCRNDDNTWSKVVLPTT
jgi:hypothetical protein